MLNFMQCFSNDSRPLFVLESSNCRVSKNEKEDNARQQLLGQQLLGQQLLVRHTHTLSLSNLKGHSRVCLHTVYTKIAPKEMHQKRCSKWAINMRNHQTTEWKSKGSFSEKVSGSLFWTLFNSDCGLSTADWTLLSEQANWGWPPSKVKMINNLFGY